MIRLYGYDRIAAPLRGSLIALGNFDGFHAGHQAVVRRAVHHAREQQRSCIVATFDPHPMRFFKPKVPPFRLTSLDQRQSLFAAAGADVMLILPFDAVLADTSAEDFIDELLLERFGIAGAVTGSDFVFGKRRGGTVKTLTEHASKRGFFADIVSAVSDGEIISSSRIREALRTGDCATATRLLTRPFTIEGVVQHGDKNGRLLGFPTANLDMGRYVRPCYGIYAVTGHLTDGRVLKGAANLGIRPSFTPPKELLESYFFDFDEDIYGQRLTVALHSFLRSEAQFTAMDALKAQMAKDCDEARKRLESLGF